MNDALNPDCPECARLRDVAQAAQRGTSSQVIRIEYIGGAKAVVTMADAEAEQRLGQVAADALGLLLNTAEAIRASDSASPQ